MKTLLLMRHAKAAATQVGSTDIERPLNAEGREAAERIGEFIREKGLEPELGLSSSALRARETREIVTKAAGLKLVGSDDSRIYEAGAGELLEIITGFDDQLTSVFLVGHNPTLEDLLLILTGNSTHLSPGTLAKIDLESQHWTDAVLGEGKLDWIVRPKDLD
jgi:phosphohistidine phosphatase